MANRSWGYSSELVAEATGYAGASGEEILGEKTFRELENKHKEELKDESHKGQCGGLYIIGTERHESRRIDNQLRGRSGRQGDPGHSQFFLSAEDDLFRLFTMNRFFITSLLFSQSAICRKASVISKSIESARKKVEANNFATRRNVLEFDDVMNERRQKFMSTIRYSTGADLKQLEDDKNVRPLWFSSTAPSSLPENEWNLAGMKTKLGWIIGSDSLNDSGQFILNTSSQRSEKLYNDRKQEYGAEIMSLLEKNAYFRAARPPLDGSPRRDGGIQKRGIYLRSYGQQSPISSITRMETTIIFRNDDAISGTVTGILRL